MTKIPLNNSESPESKIKTKSPNIKQNRTEQTTKQTNEWIISWNQDSKQKWKTRLAWDKRQHQRHISLGPNGCTWRNSKQNLGSTPNRVTELKPLKKASTTKQAIHSLWKCWLRRIGITGQVTKRKFICLWNSGCKK